jgi:hypothetical protein
LFERVERALAMGGDTSAVVTPEGCISAATTMLAPLLAHENAGRECALDLLAADALVTYAFEAASADPESLDERASAAMRAIAALAAKAPRSSARG